MLDTAGLMTPAIQIREKNSLLREQRLHLLLSDRSPSLARSFSPRTSMVEGVERDWPATSIIVKDGVIEDVVRMDRAPAERHVRVVARRLRGLCDAC